MANSLELWIVQLDELIQHAIKLREDNVMKYRRNMKKAFDMGLNMFILLMRHMIDDMVKENSESRDE